MKCKGKAVLAKGTKDEVWGVCDDLSVKQAADKEQVKDGDGDTVAILWTDERLEGTVNFTPYAVASNVESPVTKESLIGEVLEFSTYDTNKVKFYIDDAELKLKKGAVATWSCSGTYYAKVAAADAAAAGGA